MERGSNSEPASSLIRQPTRVQLKVTNSRLKRAASLAMHGVYSGTTLSSIVIWETKIFTQQPPFYPTPIHVSTTHHLICPYLGQGLDSAHTQALLPGIFLRQTRRIIIVSDRLAAMR